MSPHETQEPIVKRRCLAMLCAAVLCLRGGPSAAEEPTSDPTVPLVTPNMRVRLEASGAERVMGTVVSLDHEILTLRLDQPGWQAAELRRIRLPEITQLEIARSTGRQTRKGALIGGGVGLALDVAVVALLSAGTNAREPATPTLVSTTTASGEGSVVVFFLTPIAVGAALGALIGSAIRGQRWEPVPLAPKRVSFAIAPTSHHGWTAALSFEF
jgi:hypothetical protein